MWKRTAVLKGHSAPIYAVTVIDEYIYTAAGDRFVARWDALNGLQDTFSIRLDAVAYVLAAGDAHCLFAACTNGTVICVDVQTKQLLWERNYFGRPVFSMVWNRKHRQLILGDAESNLLVIGSDGEKLIGFNLASGKIRALEISEDSLFVGTQNGSVHCFDLLTFNEIETYKAHNGSIHALLYLKSKQALLSGGADGYLVLTDLLTYRQLLRIPAHYQSIYGLIEVGEQIISCSMDKTIKIWNKTPWEVQQRVEWTDGGHKRSVNALHVISSGSFVSVSDDKEAHIWGK